jgi:RHS repeat-associated protein
VGNRLTMKTDDEEYKYSYNANNQLLSENENTYEYDQDGNLISRSTDEDLVTFSYNGANKLVLAEFEDESYASYSYDAFGRRVYREEMSWKDLDGIGKGKEKSNNGKGKGNCKDQSPGNGQFNNPGQGKKIGLYKKYGENGNSHVYHKETTYLYEGLSTDLHKEYSATGSPYAEYYKGPNGQLTSRKMFGNHGLSNPAHDPNLKTTGGMLYYQYDGQRAVSETTDRHGDIIERYRYDAFGGIFTGITSPYNHHGYTGMLYDGKTGFVDMNARWYEPNIGRFMSEDTYPGEWMNPQSQNRYAYVMNNPVNMWDPTGHVAEYLDGGSYTGANLPSWVRNYESHAEEETIYNTLYVHLWLPKASNPTVIKGDTQLVDIEDRKTSYRHYLRNQETTLWYYGYQKYKIEADMIEKPIGAPKDVTFQETVTKNWHIDISAKDIAKVNQEYIAGLEAPPNAVVKVERWMNGETLTKDLLSSHLSKHEGKGSQGDSDNVIITIGEILNKGIRGYDKSKNSFIEIGQGFGNGLSTRADNSLNSFYDFVNYLSIGMLDGIWSGAKERQMMLGDSSYDTWNYWTFGALETVDKAINPDDPLSAEHWLNSFGVATAIVGGGAISQANKSVVKSSSKVIPNKVSGNFNYKTISQTPAEDVNKWWKDEMGYSQPPYKPGTVTQEIELTQKTTFGRVYDGENSGMYGGWFMKAKDIKGLTPQQIQDKFALPTTPKYVVDVELDVGTKIRTGTVNPLFGFNGGGQQFDLMGQRVGNFANSRPLP